MMRICVERLSFAYVGHVPLIEDATFVLSAGWTGIVGPNGCGKSTLIQLLDGAMRPDDGEIRFEPLGALTTVVEQKCDSLGASPGEVRQQQLFSAVASEPDVLIIDEPTNHLDETARAQLVKQLLRFRGIGLIVSHDRELLDRVTTHTLRFHGSQLRLWRGSYSDAKLAWEREQLALCEARGLAHAAIARTRRQLVHSKESQRGAQIQRSAGVRMKDKNDSDQRTGTSRGRAESAGAAHGQRVRRLQTSLDRLQNEMPKFEGARELGRSIFWQGSECPSRIVASRAAGPLVSVNGTIALLPSLSVQRGEHIWISGPNGCGKTTLVKNVDYLTSRTFVLSQDTDVGPNEVPTLERSLKSQILSLVAALGVPPQRVLASARLSFGEARKLALARSLIEPHWLLVLDEPTNHLDLPSIEVLEQALAAYRGAILLVSHDERFARACCTTHWAFEGQSVRVRALMKE